ncbi:MAG: DUF4276 family protein [Lentisphaerae bacterium]|jgi:hypothetical protein|nr:DUF4276 family protein [Lentisphaerota bacterium]
MNNNNYVTVVVITEGPSELEFVKNLLNPYLAEQGILLTPTILRKPGESGGDVKFARVRNDIEMHLKQRPDTFLTFLVDYYGIKSDWPGYTESRQQSIHTHKAEIINLATAKEVKRLFPKLNPTRRFIPYVSMHELEALYFSDPACLAEKLGARQADIDAILAQCGEPENINDNPDTAPSKRLENLRKRTGFKKTSTGIAIAQAIGISKMRSKCPLFHDWLTKLESLTRNNNGQA